MNRILATLINRNDFQRSILCCLAAIAGARPELAEAVVAGGALPAALLHAGHDAAPVRRAAACLLRDIVKQSIDVSLKIKIIHERRPPKSE